ncbi:dephospho-CoA kinase [candidate division WOR-3 bacterium]|nr:dephospho-CoA kinase [candidate division WOR-3 bacterium]
MVSDKERKVIVGVVGRLGAGKSTFSKMLAGHGARLFEADKIAWKLYAIPAIKKDIKATFSNKVFDEYGEVSRRKLGEVVFSDPLALRRLDAIVHPALVGELEYIIGKTQESVVVIDAALLLDWTLAQRCDLVIAVVADEETSIKRLEQKKIRAKRARAVLRNQRTEDEFRRLCRIVIENNGNLEDLKVKAGWVWKNYVEPLIT